VSSLANRNWTTEDLDWLDRLGADESRDSFWSYRQYLNPKMIKGWWQQTVAMELHRFWLEYKAGRRPKLLLQSPPQHGKSFTVIDFLSWIAGHDPSLKVIFSSYSDRLGIRANLRLQRIFRSHKHRLCFGNILGDDTRQNSQIVEFASDFNDDTKRGYFRNTTVLGAITGEGLDIGVIDDPIKGRAEASSLVTRNKTWDWLTDDFMTRFSDHAGLLMIMTRWHLDDPAGRLIEQYPGVRSLRYPAIAECDELYQFKTKSGVMEMRRKEGEPLFPELKSMDFLRKQRDVMTLAGWQSIYQQTPIIVGGDMFPIEKIEVTPEQPNYGDVATCARYWDKAGTADGGAFTAGVLMARMRDGTYVVCDVRRGQWSALDRERMIKQTAAVDKKFFPTTRVYIEQEPGSGGKDSAEATVRMLAGYSAEADKVTGAKEVRAEPFAAQWQAGNVRLVAADWNRNYLDEHEHFPAGKYKDQVDASAGAFNRIASKYRYDSSLRWVSDGNATRPSH
jgi:predicted phage terminase large subunit-like protein